MFIWFIILGVLFYLLFNDKLDINFKKSDRASTLLKERLAKGEITPEEYKRIKQIVSEEKE